MIKIGILYICTGHYSIFWKEFYESMERYFIGDAEKHYFVFTDSAEIAYEKVSPNIHRIIQADLGWPDNTLLRFHIFLEHEKELINMDYLFFFNANLLVLRPIRASDFLPTETESSVATLHPGFYAKDRSLYPYENNKNSTAYIPRQIGTHYFAGGLNGGRTPDFIATMKIMRENIDSDNARGVVALWHDESHWNKFLSERNNIKVLSPAYLYPEGWVLPFDPIILIRDKTKYGGHNRLRNQKPSIVRTVGQISKKIIRKLYRAIF